MLQAFRILFLPQDWLETVYGISGVKNVCGMELRYEKFTKVANDISKNLTATVKKRKRCSIYTGRRQCQCQLGSCTDGSDCRRICEVNGNGDG